MVRIPVLYFLVLLEGTLSLRSLEYMRNLLEEAPLPHCDPITEELDHCPRGRCVLDFCPIYEVRHPIDCKKPRICPPPACKCKFNYKRNEHGQCVHIHYCPPFSCPGKNEEYQACPRYCPTEECSDAHLGGLCPWDIDMSRMPCTPKCRCKKGTFRNKYGECVDINACSVDDFSF